MPSALLVFVGGMVGAPVRYLTDRAVKSSHDSLMPWGTFTVNILGSAILGCLWGASVGSPIAALIGVGFCGALTTYSTFGYETVRLIEDGAYVYALTNVVASLAVGLGAAISGSAATQWVLA